MNRETDGSNYVMVVDDDPVIVEMTTIVLEGEGYVVHSFTDPKEVVKAIEAGEEVDVVLSDYNMGKVNGAQLSEQVAELIPKIPIILMSASASDLARIGHVERLLSEGTVYAALGKPFDIGKLAEVVANALAERPISYARRATFMQEPVLVPV